MCKVFQITEKAGAFETKCVFYIPPRPGMEARPRELDYAEGNLTMVTKHRPPFVVGEAVEVVFGEAA